MTRFDSSLDSTDRRKKDELYGRCPTPPHTRDAKRAKPEVRSRNVGESILGRTRQRRIRKGGVALGVPKA